MSHLHHHGDVSHGGEALADDRGVRRALLWALGLNGFFLVIEATIGFITGSLALLSDAAHMVNDVGALALAMGAATLARRPASPRRSYGYRRAEVLGALFSGILLLAACVFIFAEAIERLGDGAVYIPGWPVLVVGIIGLAINLTSAWHLSRAGSASLNIRGALLHMLADAAGSVGAIAAALFVLMGYPRADAVVSTVIGALVLWAAYGLIRDSLGVLLQFAQRGVDPEQVRSRLLSLSQVNDVHDLHVWSLDGQAAIVSAHVVVSEVDPALPSRAAELLRRELSIRHSTIQIELDEGCPSARCCPLAAPKS